VIATPAGPPTLLNEYKGTGNSAGSTHDFQVITEQQGPRDEVARPLFIAADEQSIRVFDLAKPRCIKKGLSGWVQQLLPATSSSSSEGEKQERFVCTGGSICGQDSIWCVSSSAVEKVSSPQLPFKGSCLIQHPTTLRRYFGINDSKIVELELVSMPSGGESDWRSAEWRLVREIGDLGDSSYGQRPWLSPEGRLYSLGRHGMTEWAW
jgi:hypothetical protein